MITFFNKMKTGEQLAKVKEVKQRSLRFHSQSKKSEQKDFLLE